MSNDINNTNDKDNIVLFDINNIPDETLDELSNNKGEDESSSTSTSSNKVTKLTKLSTSLYTNSSLVNYTKLSSNCNSPRNHVIDTITIHCVVGQCAIETLGAVFYDSARQASSNYGIGYDGKIGLFVEEKNRSWCSGGKDKDGNIIRVNGISGADNDHRAITIEVASDTTSPYAVTDKAYTSLLNLVTDICKRNNIKELKWKSDKSYVGQIDKQNMTVHRWFANKSCCGDYLYNKHSDIIKEVNKRLIGSDTVSDTTTTIKESIEKYNAYTYVIKLPKKDYTTDFVLCEQPKETLSHFYNRAKTKPTYLINGGFFAMSTGDTAFTYKDENKMISDSIYKMGFGVTIDGIIKYCMSNDSSVKDFLCGYPYLVHDGKKLEIYYAKDIAGKNPRTAIGYNDDYYFIVIVDGRTVTNKGMTFSELADVFIKIGAKYALGADGGGSTRCLKNGVVVNQPIEDRPVDNVICFYKKGIDINNTTKVVKSKCQISSYSNLINATLAETKLKTAGFTTYLETVSTKLYRVGVVDYSLTNSELLAKVKNAGYTSAIIVSVS